MKKLFLFILLLSGISGTSAAAPGPEGVISRAAVAGTNYCHLKFPAIREDTLFSDRPVLKDARNGDIIDFYGPCDHDPLGKEEVASQRAYYHLQQVEKANQD